MALTEKCAPWCLTGQPRLIPVKIASTQTWTAPAPIYINTSGQAKICVDSDSASEIAIKGFAYADAASPDANTEVYIGVITARQFWAIWASNNGSDSACTQANVGNVYGHSVEGSSPYVGYMTIDFNLTSYKSMYVEDIMSNQNTSLVASTSTSPGAAIVRFLQDALDATLS